MEAYAPRGCTQALEAMLPGAKEDALARAPEHGADIVQGKWPCCGSADYHAGGCRVGFHSAERRRCKQCGLWLLPAQLAGEECTHHVKEPIEFAAGGAQWLCCGLMGYKGTKYGAMHGADPEGVTDRATGSNTGACAARRRSGCVKAPQHQV